MSKIFDVRVCVVEDWGYIPTSTLFGESDDADVRATNNPFRVSRQAAALDPDDTTRSGFVRHCFAVLRTSSGAKVVDICAARHATEVDDENDAGFVAWPGGPILATAEGLVDVDTYLQQGRDKASKPLTIADVKGKLFLSCSPASAGQHEPMLMV